MFPALGNRNLIPIGQLCDHGFSVIFTDKEVSLTGPNATLTGTRNTNNRLYYIDLQNLKPAQNTHLPHQYLCSNNFHTLSTKSDIMQYLHRAAFSPGVSTWTTAITAYFFTTWPGLNSALVRKHFPKSLATAKGHLRQNRKKFNDPPETLLLPLPSTNRSS